MKKAKKAASLSAFVFPGMGHFFLKEKLVGAIFAAAAAIPTFVIAQNTMAKTEKLAEQIANREIPMDFVTISEALSKLALNRTSPELAYATYGLLSIWALAIFDAYRLGKKLEG